MIARRQRPGDKRLEVAVARPIAEVGVRDGITDRVVVPHPVNGRWLMPTRTNDRKMRTLTSRRAAVAWCRSPGRALLSPKGSQHPSHRAPPPPETRSVIASLFYMTRLQ